MPPQVLEKLSISRLNAEENKVTVSQTGQAGGEATRSFSDLEEWQDD